PGAHVLALLSRARRVVFPVVVEIAVAALVAVRAAQSLLALVLDLELQPVPLAPSLLDRQPVRSLLRRLLPYPRQLPAIPLLSMALSAPADRLRRGCSSVLRTPPLLLAGDRSPAFHAAAG